MPPTERQNSPSKEVQAAQAAHSQAVWVQKWIDYSSKYGLGYILSDNSCGVFFNDSTKIVVEQHGTNFYFYERK